MAKKKNTKPKTAKKRKTVKKRKVKRGTIKCPKCDRTFSMPWHLGRHMSAIHGIRKKKKGAMKVRSGRKGRRPGRSAGVAARLGLQEMTSAELSQLITAAKQEAQRRLSDLQKALK